MTILHLSLALVADPINAIIPSVIVFLSWAAGMYWFGPSDAAKRIKGIKHDGRRFAYRGAMVAAVCGLIWCATSWPLASAIMTLLASGFAMSIGVRVGFNLAAGVDWRYLGSTSVDDWWFVWRFYGAGIDWAERIVRQNHHILYTSERAIVVARIEGEPWLGSVRVVVANYVHDVHRAGASRTLVEALAAIILVAAQLWI